MRGKSHAWLKDNLENRRQIVKLPLPFSRNAYNMWGNSGICSWALTFPNIINDLANCTSNNLVSTIFFADDTNLFYSGQDISIIESVVNKELIRVEEWLKCNQLTLNIKKSNFIVFKPYEEQKESCSTVK